MRLLLRTLLRDVEIGTLLLLLLLLFIIVYIIIINKKGQLSLTNPRDAC